MDDKPIRDERILEAIEACRPGSDDVADPQMAHLAAAMAADPQLEDLYERLQALDARLAAGVQDVPVPDGLGQRLIEGLAAARPRRANPPGSDEPAVAVPSRPRRVSRRWLAIAGATLTAAAVLLIAALVSVSKMSPRYDAPAVREIAVKFFNDELPKPGHLLAEKSPPADYPISPAVARNPLARFPNMRWRRIYGFLNSNGVAYDLAGGGSRATLYVVNRSVAGLPGAPSLIPGLTTAECSTSAWQSGGLLYVLVVRGGPRAYRSYLDLPRGPVT